MKKKGAKLKQGNNFGVSEDWTRAVGQGMILLCTEVWN